MFELSSKPFSELTDEDLSRLKGVYSQTGVFRFILKNHERKLTKDPSKIILTTASYYGKVIGWLLEDEAGEYNEYISEVGGDCSIMVFVEANLRKRGLAKKLVEHRAPFLTSKKLVAYPSSTKAKRFFAKLKQLNLNVEFQNPVFYTVKEEE